MAIENLQIESKASFPPGIVVPWMGGYFGDGSNGSYTSVEDGSVLSANTFLDGFGWAVCDGAAKNDLDSHFYNGAGRYLPNLTDDRFLMGSSSNGTVGGSNTLLDHTHTDTLVVDAHTHNIDHGHANTLVVDAHSHNINHGHADTISAAQTAHRHYHDHGAFTSGAESANHDHLIGIGAGLLGPGYGTGVGANSSNVQGSGASTTLVKTSTELVAHAHPIDVPAIYSDYQTPAITVSGAVTSFTGSSGGASSSSISGAVTNFTGSTAASSSSSISGTVGTGSAASITENRPKYLTCLYIIKIR